MKKLNRNGKLELNVAYKRLLNYIKMYGIYKYDKEKVGSMPYYVELYCNYLKIPIPKVKVGRFIVAEYNRKDSPIFRGLHVPKYKGKKFDYKKYEHYLRTDKWKGFKSEIVNVRGQMCERCGVQTTGLDLHHLTYERLFNELPEDVQLLCKTCHRREHQLI